MSRTQVTCAVLSLVASVMSSAFESSVTALEILAPVDFHVVQIANRGSTSLPVTGTLQIYEEDVPRLEWRLIGASGNPSWEVLSATHVQDQFSATLPVDPGGWYRLDLRQLHGGEVVGQASVEHVGVGEIFVVAGQSNSANHGEKQLTPETNRVVVF
ncbi:MAG: hypothetical protein KDA99_03430, partial [Planctomycetales bacterium]|nr:hypothetical protein [Planctomycetales bacterium]